MTRAMICFVLSVSAFAGDQHGPFSLATNFAVDLNGRVDIRPGCYGTAEAKTFNVSFKAPPEGYRVRILRAYGDLVAWPMGKADPGKFAGVLVGLQTTGPEGSVRADYAADNTMLYMQTGTSGDVSRIPINADVNVGGLLEPDNVLVVKLASWLNTMGVPVHAEATFVVVYEYERIIAAAAERPRS